MKKDNSNKGFWQRFAFLYTPFMKKNEVQYAAVYGLCKKYLNSDMRALELACGTGQFSETLAKDVKYLEASDFSEKMLKRAKKKTKAQNVNFSLQDATRLLYADGTFDAVFIANALHIMPAPELALKEINRVLKKGGVLFAPTFVYDYGKSKTLSAMERIGFKTFHKWQSGEFATFVSDFGFSVREAEVIAGKVVPECVLIAIKEQVSDR